MISIILEEETTNTTIEIDRFSKIIKSLFTNHEEDITKNDLLYMDVFSLDDIDLAFVERNHIPKNITINSIEDLGKLNVYSSCIGSFSMIVKDDNFDFFTASLSEIDRQDITDFLDVEKLLYFKFDLYLYCKKMCNNNLQNKHISINNDMLFFRDLLYKKIKAYKFKLEAVIVEFNNVVKEYYNFSFYIPYKGAHYIKIQFEKGSFSGEEFLSSLSNRLSRIFSIEWEREKIALDEYLDILSMLSY